MLRLTRSVFRLINIKKMKKYLNQPKINKMSPAQMEEYFIDFMAQILVDQIINENGEKYEQQGQVKHQNKTLE